MKASNKSVCSVFCSRWEERGFPAACCRLGAYLLHITMPLERRTLNSSATGDIWGTNFHHRRTCLHAYVFASAHVPVSELICSLESSLKIPPSSVMWLIATLRLRLSSSEGCDARQDHMLVTKRNASVMNARILTLSNQHQFILNMHVSRTVGEAEVGKKNEEILKLSPQKTLCLAHSSLIFYYLQCIIHSNGGALKMRVNRKLSVTT